MDETGDTAGKCTEMQLRLEDELAATAVSWRWSGDAATAARQQIRTLNDRAEHLVAEASSVQRALYDASDGVRDLRHAVTDADAKAAANRFTIPADGAIRDDALPLPPPQSRFEAEEMAQVQQHRARVRAELDHEIQQIMMRAGEIDRTRADVMTKAGAAEISDESAVSLAEAAEDMDRRRELDEILEEYQVDPDPGGWRSTRRTGCCGRYSASGRSPRPRPTCSTISGWVGSEVSRISTMTRSTSSGLARRESLPFRLREGEARIQIRRATLPATARVERARGLRQIRRPDRLHLGHGARVQRRRDADDVEQAAGGTTALESPRSTATDGDTLMPGQAPGRRRRATVARRAPVAGREVVRAEAGEVPAGSRGLLLYFTGERTPMFDSDARGILA